jgi:hypothetical protein
MILSGEKRLQMSGEPGMATEQLCSVDRNAQLSGPQANRDHIVEVWGTGRVTRCVIVHAKRRHPKSQDSGPLSEPQSPLDFSQSDDWQAVVLCPRTLAPILKGDSFPPASTSTRPRCRPSGSRSTASCPGVSGAGTAGRGTITGPAEGHREAHGQDSSSPYWRSGYNLALRKKRTISRDP